MLNHYAKKNIFVIIFDIFGILLVASYLTTQNPILKDAFSVYLIIFTVLPTVLFCLLAIGSLLNLDFSLSKHFIKELNKADKKSFNKIKIRVDGHYVIKFVHLTIFYCSLLFFLLLLDDSFLYILYIVRFIFTLLIVLKVRDMTNKKLDETYNRIYGVRKK